MSFSKNKHGALLFTYHALLFATILFYITFPLFKSIFLYLVNYALYFHDVTTIYFFLEELLYIVHLEDKFCLVVLLHILPLQPIL